MRIGNLRERITLQQRSTEQDDWGEPLNTWTDVATVWANVFDVSGREYFAAQATQNSAQTRIIIRYMAGVLPSMRVLHGANTYDIEAVLGQDKRQLTLICKRQA